MGDVPQCLCEVLGSYVGEAFACDQHVVWFHICVCQPVGVDMLKATGKAQGKVRQLLQFESPLELASLTSRLAFQCEISKILPIAREHQAKPVMRQRRHVQQLQHIGGEALRSCTQ